MLTEKDIELMSRTYREEIAYLRTRPVIFVREVEVPGDPFQGGGGIEEVADESTTDVIWTEIRNITEGGLDSVIDGVKIERGDVLAGVSSDIDVSNAVKAKYDEVTYAIMTKNNLGIGDTYRTEMLLRKVT